MPIVTTVFAKETGSTLASGQHRYHARVAYYEIPIIPSIPLHIGQTICIKTITHCDPHPLLPAKPPLTQYVATDTGIQGRIIKVSAMRNTTTEFMVRNDLPGPSIAYAFITIHHIQGVTVRLSLWRRLMRSLHVKSRHAANNTHLEPSAIIYEDVTTSHPKHNPTSSFLDHDDGDDPLHANGLPKDQERQVPNELPPGVADPAAGSPLSVKQTADTDRQPEIGSHASNAMQVRDGGLLQGLEDTMECMGVRILPPEEELARDDIELQGIPKSLIPAETESELPQLVDLEDEDLDGAHGFDKGSLDTYELSDSSDDETQATDSAPRTLIGPKGLTPMTASAGARAKKRARVDSPELKQRSLASEGKHAEPQHREGSYLPSPGAGPLLAEAQREVLDATAKTIASALCRLLGEATGAGQRADGEALHAFIEALLPTEAQIARKAEQNPTRPPLAQQSPATPATPFMTAKKWWELTTTGSDQSARTDALAGRTVSSLKAGPSSRAVLVADHPPRVGVAASMWAPGTPASRPEQHLDSDAEYWAAEDSMEVDPVPQLAAPSLAEQASRQSSGKEAVVRPPKPGPARVYSARRATSQRPKAKVALSLWDERSKEIAALGLLAVDLATLPEIHAHSTTWRGRHIPPPVLSHFQKLSPATKIVAEAYGYSDMDDAMVRKVTGLFERALEVITGRRNFSITAPIPKPLGVDDDEAPSAFMISDLLPQEHDCLTERRAWLTRDFAFFVYKSESDLPRYVGALLGLIQANEEVAKRIVREEFLRQPNFNSIKHLVGGNPDFRGVDEDTAAKQIIDTLDVKVRPVNDTEGAALVAHVYMDPPTKAKTLWEEWREGMRARPFSELHPRLRYSARLPSCAGCHSADHLDHQCPLPHLEGWGAAISRPVRKPARNPEAPPAYQLMAREDDGDNRSTAGGSRKPPSARRGRGMARR
ncbi:hypothetical protein C8Q78DRAFT_1073872 [Trametes maxima]|nr:hypothetical protein C8Q78DRAFT_1073872 [Trametes maxima]